MEDSRLDKYDGLGDASSSLSLISDALYHCNFSGRKPKMSVQHAEALLKMISTIVIDLQELIVEHPPDKEQIELMVRAAFGLGKLRKIYIEKKIG